MSSANNPFSLTYPTSSESKSKVKVRKSKAHKHFAALHDLKRGARARGPFTIPFFKILS